jgi:hypothetical protein
MKRECGPREVEVLAKPGGFNDTFVSLYGDIHDQLRKEISDLGEPALTWIPGPDTNSISTLVIHLLGSEAEVLRTVRGLASDRDRSAEFTANVRDAEELQGRIGATDRLLEELGAQISQKDLDTARVRPSALDRTPRTGLYWLLNSYGHAREHLAQLQLTKQLFHQTHPQ